LLEWSLPELLPELFEHKESIKKIIRLENKGNRTGIELEMCEAPDEKDMYASIIPDYFLSAQNLI
jgi:hypothetical protein